MIARGRLVYANPKTVELFGYPDLAAMLALPSFEDLLQPFERERVRAVERARSQGEPAPSEYEVVGRRLDGSPVDLLNRPALIDWEDEPEAILATVVDITAEKKRREAISAQSALFELILDHMDHGFSIFDARGICRAVNRRSLDLLGVPSDVFHVGCRYEHLVRFIAERGEYGAEDPDFYVDQWKHLGRQKETFTRERTRQNGTTLELRRTPLPDGGFVATHTDISARKRAEEALRESEERYRTLTEGSLQGIGIVQDHRVAFVNSAFADLLGYTREEMTGRPVADFIQPEHQDMVRSRRIARLEGGTPPDRYDLQVRHRDGHGIWVDQLVQIATWNGRAALQISIIDISQRKRAETAVLAAKEEAEFANRAKSEFLAHFSHELRTPLNAIIGFSDVMQQEMFGPIGESRYLDYARDISRSGEHLLDLINDILDLSRIESGEWELDDRIFDASDIARECSRLLGNRARERDVEIEMVLPERSLHLRADRRQVQQIALNLLSNAVKFTSRGTRVHFSLSLNAQQQIQFRFDDQGPGMSQSEILRVQEPFVRLGDAMTSSAEGSGLGLAITKRLIEYHGGVLHILSGQGTGTTAIVEFPRDRYIRPGDVDLGTGNLNEG